MSRDYGFAQRYMEHAGVNIKDDDSQTSHTLRTQTQTTGGYSDPPRDTTFQWDEKDEAFVSAIRAMAIDVVRFHKEFGIQHAYGLTLKEVLKDRLGFLMEEVGEHSAELNRGNAETAILGELSDVLYIVLGSLERSAFAGVEAVKATNAKNQQKTQQTHYLNRQGKVVRRDLGGNGS